MGKSIVSEIHPSQIADAAEFLTRTFMRLNSAWFRFCLNLPEFEQEYLDQLSGTIANRMPIDKQMTNNFTDDMMTIEDGTFSSNSCELTIL